MENVQDVRIDPAKLKRARGGRGLSAVAKTIGISRQLLWNYENGVSHPPANKLARLCYLYECEIRDVTTICGKNATNGEDRNLPARDIAGKIVHVSAE